MIKTKKNKTLIIAEIGPNHNGSVMNANKMIHKLAKINVDVVKFQLANPHLVYSNDAFKAEYQKKNDPKRNILEMSKSFQLTKNNHIKIAKLCKKVGLIYACTAFDLKSLIFLDKKIKVPFFKIASGEIHSIDMLEYIAKRNKPIFLSTGMASFEEIKKSLAILTKHGNNNITILHCVSSYPAKKNSLNLNIIDELKKRFRKNIGYSDHSLGNEACLAAVAKGATVIEKHVTLSKLSKGPDHKSSSTIEGFKILVKKVRSLEEILGSNKKFFTKDEINVKKVARKSLVSSKNISQGKKIKREDINFKRPGTGISPLDIKKIIGKKIKKSKKKNRIFFYNDFI
jgi:N,N'-diacetyllegionaminate synthase